MKRLMTVLGVLALGAAGLFGYSTADAGESDPGAFQCREVGGKVLCSGTLASARASSGSGDFALFRLNSLGDLTFFASHGGKSHTCSFGRKHVEGFAAAALSMGPQGYFQVQIDGKTCNGSLDNHSKYLPAK